MSSIKQSENSHRARKYTFHVSGTHCASCKILIEDILGEQDFIKTSRVNLQKEVVEIETENEKSADEIAKILTDKIRKHGYTLSVEKKIQGNETKGVIWKALPIGLGLLALFFILQRSGVLNLGLGGQTTPITSFIVGLIASVSTCLAIVGGLVLSLSAEAVLDEGGSAKKPFILFHISRLVGFGLLGGLLGLIGEAMGVNFTFSAILGAVASVVMILLGLNLAGVFKKNKFTLPGGIFSFFRKVEHATLTPIVLGVGTFFLPCGFTQSMQVAALSSGSFVSGTMIMFAFALGTLPVLSLLSFGSVSFAHSRYAPLFFKSAGVLVIGFGLFSLLAGLVGLGIISPLFNI